MLSSKNAECRSAISSPDVHASTVLRKLVFIFFIYKYQNFGGVHSPPDVWKYKGGEKEKPNKDFHLFSPPLTFLKIRFLGDDNHSADTYLYRNIPFMHRTKLDDLVLVMQQDSVSYDA